MGLWFKMYFVLKAGRENIKNAKGVKKTIMKKHIHYEQCKESLFSFSKKISRHGINVLRSEGFWTVNRAFQW